METRFLDCPLRANQALIRGTLQVTHADENDSHFPSLASDDINTALCNIQRYNEKLSAITSKVELTTEDMVKVHELTYTLENAVNFLTETLEQVSVDLEKVHLASEVLDPTVIKSAGGKYLAPTSQMISPIKC